MARKQSNTAETEKPAEATQDQNGDATDTAAATTDTKAQEAAQRERDKAAERERKAQAKIEAENEKVAALLTENGIDGVDVKATGENGRITLRDARDAVKAKRAAERANRPKKASLTLSQRRAVLKLADGPITPHTDFNQLPLKYLVQAGLAKVETVTIQEPYTETTTREVEIPESDRKPDGPTTRTEKVKEEKLRDVERNQYSLTEEGEARAKELNPKWKTWKAPGADDSSATESPASEPTAA